jgi:histidine triad (HIT) family protein
MSTNELQQTDCFICRKHRGEIEVPGGPIYEDDLLYASHIGNPHPQKEQAVYLGYMFVEPRRHAPGLADLTDVEAQAIGLLVTRLSRALKVTEGAEHIYAFVLGDHVPHLHIHVVPRYPGAPPEYWGNRVDEWPGAPRGGTEEIAALAARLRSYLESEK